MSQGESEVDSFHIDTKKHTLHVGPIDINTSLSSLTTAGVSLDNILRKCGDFGRFQIMHYVFLSIMTMNGSITSFYYVFGAATPDHRCRLPTNVWPDDKHYSPLNQTHEIFINQYIPKNNDGKQWKKCVRYVTSNRSGSLVNCPDGWAYDQSIFGYTFTEEADFVCQNESKRSWLATAVQCGGFSLLIIGSLADRYGRKKMISIVTFLLFFACLITLIIMQSIPMTIKTKFIVLLLNQFVSGLAFSIYSLVFILVLELTSAEHTGLAGNLIFVASTMGQILAALFAFMTRDWQKLKWANTSFIGLGIPYLYFMPESPLYTYAKRQYIPLETILRRIATQNGRKETDWYPCYQELLRNQPIKLSHKNELTYSQKSYRLFFRRATIIKLLLTAVIGFTTLMIYIKISFSLAMLNISPHLGIFIGAVVEAIGCLISTVLISSRLGRKGSFILTMSLTIISLLLIPIIVKYSSIASVGLAQFGKFTISSATAIAWIFVPELFPTSIRSTANAVFIAFSRIGAIVAPILNTETSKPYAPYTFYGSALIAFVVVLFSLMLPETKDKPMDDVTDYTESMTDI
ncbi:unnamed protein product [Rotaria socialis]|uniref:Major facilitator superfamily (MFS) profile domain-containing protein n=1 Tax=Rotaria socialis TaxID=392032 RepID=A0A820PT12_9BILA|nr:unnamed protein product [Rotaria socialis]CAF3456356.1 unnamed protein product [Rotaria socialis]CAF4411101.1 unnamed protein product [Rotaria socialis]CAF4580440.1 unnamed protein product [Rotaria socialis]